MKKVIVLLLLAIGFSESMVAQKGMSSLGVNIPMHYRKNNFSTGIGINYQYNFSNYFRGELVATYMPIHISKSITTDSYYYSAYTGTNYTGTKTIKSAYVLGQALLNAHLFFSAPRHIRPYLIVGGGIQVYNKHQQTILSDRIEDPGLEGVKKENRGKGVVNIGIGLDCRLSYRWTMQLSASALTAFQSADFENDDNLGFENGHKFTMEGTARIGINYNF